VLVGSVLAVLLGGAAVALSTGAKVVVLAVGGVGLAGWGAWRFLAPSLSRARPWTGPRDGAIVSVVLLWAIVEANWGGLWRGPGGVRIADLLLLGLGLYGLVSVRTAPPAVRRVVGVLVGAFGLVVAGAALAAIEHGVVGADIEGLARTAFTMVLIPAILVRFVRSERRLEAVLLATVVSVAAASIVALAVQVTELWILPFDDDFSGTRSYGLSNHPALFGIAAASTLPLAVGLGVMARGSTRLVAMLCIPLLVVGAVLSASRAPLAAGALGVTLMLIFLLSGRRRGQIAWVVVIVAMAGVAGALFPQRLARLSDTAAERSASARVELLTTAVGDVAASPLVGDGARAIKGAGGLNPKDTYVAGSTAALRVGGGTGSGDAASHNVVLQTWRAIGLPGLVGVAVVILVGVLSGVHAIRTFAYRARSLVVALVASTGVLVGCLVFFDALFERQLWLTVGLLLASGVAAPAWAAGEMGEGSGNTPADGLGTDPAGP
jgi:O-antigen ligase